MGFDLLQALCALTAVLLPLALAWFVVRYQDRPGRQRQRRQPWSASPPIGKHDAQGD